MTQSIGERIKQITEVTNVNPSKLSQEIGVQRSTFSHIINGRNKPSIDLVIKLKGKFPNLSLDWLLLGAGAMFVAEESVPTQQLSIETMDKTGLETVNEEENPPEPKALLPQTGPIQEKVYILFPNGTYKGYSPIEDD